MSSDVAGTAGTGKWFRGTPPRGVLYLVEGAEVVWGSGWASEFEEGWTGARLTLTEVRSWFASIPAIKSH